MPYLADIAHENLSKRGRLARQKSCLAREAGACGPGEHRYGNGNMFAPRSRFLPDDILPLFTRTTAPMAVLAGDTSAPQSAVSIDIGARLRGMWADL